MDEAGKSKTNVEELGRNSSLPPLADPVLASICRNVETSGLALRSFANAVLADSESPLISGVVEVTHKRVQFGRDPRSCRLGVEAVTETGDRVLVEAESSPFEYVNQWSLLYLLGRLDRGSETGGTLDKVTNGARRRVVVNILDYVVRPSGGSFHQVAQWTYQEAPFEAAFPGFEVHHLQLPKFRQIELDLSKPLHCWLRALCLARERHELMKEVVMGEPGLKSFHDGDPGFRQFVERHELVAGDPETRRAYDAWRNEE